MMSEEERDSLQSILTQEEIDVLLNGQDVAPQHQTPSAATVRKEPFPTLAKNIDVFARTLTASLRKRTGLTNAFTTLETFMSGSLEAYLNTLKNQPLFTTTKEDFLLFTDFSLAYAVIDLALGGRRGTAAINTQGRHYTKIEKNILHTFMRQTLYDLSQAFDMDFHLDSLETDVQAAYIDAPTTQMRIARLRIHLNDRSGILDVALPAHFAQKRETIQTLSDPFAVQWRQSMAHTCTDIPLEVTAELDKKTIPLKSVFKWKVGKPIPLSFFDEKPITLSCANQPLFEGHLISGKKNVTIVLSKSRLKEGDVL